MKHLFFLKILLLGLAIIAVNNINAQQLAFPGIEGYGKYTTGGRGGIVIYVTNLDDSGEGSLRYALTSSTYKGKKRTIVFSVSGTIELESTIKIKYDSCITVSGQTAPGEGICIKNYPITIGDSHDIIIRYIRSRPGDEQDCSDCDLDAMSVRKCYNIVLDHCSFSWSIDAILDLTVETGYSTVQYCLLSEALHDSKHSKGSHSMAAGWDGNSHGSYGVFGGGSYHHNLIASCNSRTPRIDSYAGENNTGVRDLLDIVNNVIYNWSSYGAYGGENADVNWIGNYYKYGPATSRKDQVFQADGEALLYLSGNYVDVYSDVTNDNSEGIYVDGSHATSTQLSSIITDTPFTVWETCIQDAKQAYTNVLTGVGAILPRRDEVDTRVISDVLNRTGSIIDSQEDVGGWPELSSGDAPTDSDVDGIPDDWEDENGLDKNDASDRNTEAEDGYTMLEKYLNSIEFDNAVENVEYSLISDDSVSITWDDTYIGESGFVIERKTDNTYYEVITTVSRNTTKYTDAFDYYGKVVEYRVAAINSDEVSTPYTVVSFTTLIEGIEADYFVFTCYPDPLFNNELHVEINPEITGNSILTITDILSRSIFQQNTNGQRSMDINLSLSKGLYFVSLKNKGEISTTKLMVK